MICPRCRFALPAHLSHDDPDECVNSLRGRLDIVTAELSAERRRSDALATRVESWKMKAKMQTHVASGSLPSRVEKVENRCSYSATKLKDIEERLMKAEQRCEFAVNQVAFMQARRAS